MRGEERRRRERGKDIGEVDRMEIERRKGKENEKSERGSEEREGGSRTSLTLP